MVHRWVRLDPDDWGWSEDLVLVGLAGHLGWFLVPRPDVFVTGFVVLPATLAGGAAVVARRTGYLANDRAKAVVKSLAAAIAAVFVLSLLWGLLNATLAGGL